MTNEHDLAPSWLTPGWLSDVLGHEVVGVDATRIGDGLVGMNLRLRLTYGGAAEGAPQRVVVKLPSPDPTSRATGIALRNYEREVKFYAEVAATVDMRVAQCHHASWDPATGDFVLVLEDLAPAAPGDQVAGCTPEQSRTAVLELAKLHGPRWNDESLHEIEWLSRRNGPEDTAQLAGLWGMFLPGFMARYGAQLSTDQREVIEAFGPRLPEWVEGRAEPFTITHGDYRLDNLMFATPEGGYPVAAVDWQTPGHGPALADVSYFMGAGPLPHARRDVERGLLMEYGEALAEYGVDLDEDWLWTHYRREAFAGIVMTVVASQIVGETERSGAMFTAMGTRHAQHAIDIDALGAF